MNNSKELNKQIISALCEKLGVKPGELFKFSNQKRDGVYFFDNKNYKLKKCVAVIGQMGHYLMPDSTVSLNWLMSDECEVELADKYMVAELEGIVNCFK